MQGVRKLQAEQHGLKEPSDLLVANTVADRVLGHGSVRADETTSRGHCADHDRPVPLPLLWQGGFRHGLSLSATHGFISNRQLI